MKEYQSHLSRRTFLRTASVMSLGGLLIPRLVFSRDDVFPVAETVYGKIRGMDVAGIKIFRGIHYGSTTENKNRFMPPMKPKSWSGIVDCMGYGEASPQLPGNPTQQYTQAVNWDQHVKAGVGEDCLVLNVWTPQLTDGNNRPVMFYIHGGGFMSGSGSLPFDGDPLSRLGDVVVVTVNHRLGALGYLELHKLGWPESYKYSGVAGMMDLVMALEWVKTNIVHFGGNPDNVTIFGQSGGGAKVAHLMAMPSAKGLFHKAAIQSGAGITAGTQDEAVIASDTLLKKLSISALKPDDIQKIHWSKITEAASGLDFRPVLDGTIIPKHPFEPEAPTESTTVPLLIGYTREETAFTDSTDPINETQLTEWAKVKFKEKGVEAVALYQRVYPNASPNTLRARIGTDQWFRKNTFLMAERKANQNAAPVYMYMVEWNSPAFEGKFGAVHGTDLGLILADPRIPIAGNTPGARKLADIFGSAIIAFAKTGNPNCKQLPQWAPYSKENRNTMILNEECRTEADPSRETRVFWENTK